MSFGLGFSMPHLTKVAGAAGVVPMTIRNSAYIAQTNAGGDFIDGGSIFFNTASVAGDVIIIAYSDDTGLAPSYPSGITGWNVPTQLANVGAWFIFQYKATGASSNFSASPTLSSNPTNYVYAAGWLVRGANATTPYESATVTAASPIVGSPVSFGVTTAANNDCVLGLAYVTPFPFAIVNQLGVFSITSPTGWTTQGPVADGNNNACFWTTSNPNIATAGTISVNATVSGAPVSVLTINLKK